MVIILGELITFRQKGEKGTLRFGELKPLRGGVLEGGGGMPYLNKDSLKSRKPLLCPILKSSWQAGDRRKNRSGWKDALRERKVFLYPMIEICADFNWHPWNLW